MGLITGLDHFTIHTDRPEETVAFFVDVLGLENRPEDRPDFGFPGAWLWLGEQPVVHLLFLEDVPPPKRGPFDHVAFSVDDYDALCAHLDGLGIEYKPSDNPDLGLRQVFLKEPNGLRVEISSRVPVEASAG